MVLFNSLAVANLHGQSIAAVNDMPGWLSAKTTEELEELLALAKSRRAVAKSNSVKDYESRRIDLLVAMNVPVEKK